ncbi:MAG TPA: ABC transporter substrate-binding protein [Verrucomicrobiae bacterium]|nr:ABC transporter substrate-binding protein [Verrucomicrobiae bacterium]
MNRCWLAALAALLLAGCQHDEAPATPGIDAARRQISIGLLNDESGPVASIGRPWAVGKRILARQINAGGSGLLPAGWSVALVERDHAYDVERAAQQFDELRDQVLFLGHSFGTPATLALRTRLQAARMVAYPASLASRMAESTWTPPLGPSSRLEAMRAMDWAVSSARRAAAVRGAIVYQQDDYGTDARDGWVLAARAHGVTLVGAHPYTPERPEFALPVGALRAAGATHVFLATVPSATGPILGAAAQAGFKPVWIGSSPSWTDRFFDSTVIAPELFANFYWVTAFAVWGENVPFMKSFLNAYDRYGRELVPPDQNVLWSYAQGLTAIEVARRMIESGALTREGYLKALQGLKHYDIQGALAEPMDYSRLPYVAGTQTRIMAPDFARGGWRAVAPYARPRALATSPAP